MDTTPIPAGWEATVNAPLELTTAERADSPPVLAVLFRPFTLDPDRLAYLARPLPVPEDTG